MVYYYSTNEDLTLYVKKYNCKPRKIEVSVDGETLV